MILIKVFAVIIYSLQIVSFLAALLTDWDNRYPENKLIQTKMDVLKFFIPLYWVIPMTIGIMRWWSKLK